MLTTTTPKWTGKSAALHIRALIALMSEEEKKALEEEGEKNGLGFQSGGLPRHQHLPYIFFLYTGPTIIILTRNNLILHGSRFTRQQQETHGTIPYYWIGKPKSYFRITLVAKA
jgi:hypothetical protein